jgi:hypothetical protein
MKKASVLIALTLGAMLTIVLWVAPIASAKQPPNPPGGGSGIGQRYPPKSTYSSQPPNCRKGSNNNHTCAPASATLPSDNRAMTLGMVLGLGLAVVVTTPLLVSRRRARPHR